MPTNIKLIYYAVPVSTELPISRNDLRGKFVKMPNETFDALFATLIIDKAIKRTRGGLFYRIHGAKNPQSLRTQKQRLRGRELPGKPIIRRIPSLKIDQVDLLIANTISCMPIISLAEGKV